MEDRLKSIGLPFREIKCYGSQITVECFGRDSCAKWAHVLGKFATVRGMIESFEYAKENKGTVLRPTRLKVWRVYARV